MFDVVHVLYEDDITPKTEHDIEVKDAVRKQLYESIYDRKYKFASTTTPGRGGTTYGLDHDEDLDSIPDLSDTRVESKGYIEPTNPEDLPLLLDPPMN